METPILSIIANSLSDAISQKDMPGFELNQTKSSLIVSIFASNLKSDWSVTDCSLKVVKVDPDGQKHSGEWLLDIVIAKEIQIKEKGFTVYTVTNLEWAIESESNSGLAAFASDFSKLAVIKSSNYLYLHGFNQATEKAALEFFKRRLDFANKILMAGGGVPSQFFIAFYPSPEKPVFKSDAQTIWDLIPDGNSPQFNQLRKIHLFQLTLETPIFLGSEQIKSRL
jgi:hypothetical protein